MKVKCIEADSRGKSLTVGKTYDVLRTHEDGDMYWIVDDADEESYWHASRFVEMLTPTQTPLARAFSTGATRDTDEGKLDYEGFLSPLVMERFAQHMHAARKMPDGTMRNSDNWQLGIETDVYMKSMWRHFFAVWKTHRGWDTDDIEAELCALIFNASGYLHEVIKAKRSA